ncbi:hypothetical protein MANES_08G053500v8 [Manihot esculenta]|uniref:Uncharacterized protein n=1 Tax=Manihot esculenta TaxID=3983 RepID=A0ACB7H931_MANES|nr:hypothetical protein MANES_08G053500v8 [Manihot esculenta]
MSNLLPPIQHQVSTSLSKSLHNPPNFHMIIYIYIYITSISLCSLHSLMARSRPSSVSSQASTSYPVLLLTLLPLTLAAFAFVLQWRGGFNDSISLSSSDHRELPGMDTTNSSISSSKSFGCKELSGRSHNQSFPYYRNWKFNFQSDLRPKICITTSTSAGLEQILPWIFYHKVIGVSSFFLFVEGKAASPNVSKVLVTVPGVKLIYRTLELEEQQARSRIWNETWLANYFYKPCNSELFVKQSLNMEMAIIMAREASMDWIIHVDTDELIHPAGAPEYSLTQLLSDVPANVDMVVFPNYESCVERDDIKEPFTEVSMFKKNYEHLPTDVYFRNYKEATRGNPNYFLTYGNGKSAARIHDHLRPNGAHRWHNYVNEMKLGEAAILHYTYPKFSDLTSRRDRCRCKPTKDDVKRCFMLEFDRIAFIIASTATEEEMLQWYREHVVWTENSLKLKLMRNGILTRIYAPMVIIQGLRESGLFRDVIVRAQTNQTEIFPSVEKSNSGKSAKSGVVSSGKIGENGDSQATARRVLQISDNGSFPSAVPPQSPPGQEDIDVEIC